MSPPRPRRPTPEQRREAILAAAGEVFFDLGYAATSIDAIIARVGGSKRTIYGEFGSKEGLFAALVQHSVERALVALSPDEIGGRDLGATLRLFGTRLMDVVMSPAVVGVYRATMTEASRFPELARLFYDMGPGRAAERLTEVLEAAKARGEVGIADCRMAADQFMGLMRDNVHLAVVLGLRPAPDAEESRRLVDSAVALFLDGARARPAEGP